MKKQLLILLLIMAYGSLVRAQRSNSYTSTGNSDTPFSLGVHVGTQGFGINAGYELGPKIAFRLASSFAPYGVNRTRNWGNQQYTVDMKAKFYNGQALVEYRPFNVADNSSFLQELMPRISRPLISSAPGRNRNLFSEYFMIGTFRIERLS